MINVVADAALPHLDALCKGWCRLRRLPGQQINAAAIRGADALLLRTVTRVDAALLEGSGLQFVGSATAGSDHIEFNALRERHISFACAPGCNANAVVDYVLAALFALAGHAELQRRSVAVVGYGNVGRRLVAALDYLGIAARVFDPLLDFSMHTLPARARQIHDFNQAFQADILSLHVPLSENGKYPTRHMLAAAELAKFAAADEGDFRPILVNSSRGAVVDNAALLDLLQGGTALRCVLDVWEHEPEPLQGLAQHVAFASPHIAGYSSAAKFRASQTIVEAMRACLLPDANPATAKAKAPVHDGGLPEESIIALPQPCDTEWLSQSLQRVCDLPTLTRQFQRAVGGDGRGRVEGFNQLRKAYPLRAEHDYTELLRGGASMDPGAVRAF